MGFKRAEWHSGLTYRQTCQQCKAILEYTDHGLDFRPWYADGFVYCPRCRTPLRHKEEYAINNPAAPVVAAPAPESGTPQAKFCAQCGTPFEENARFCAQCGNKR